MKRSCDHIILIMRIQKPPKDGLYIEIWSRYMFPLYCVSEHTEYIDVFCSDFEKVLTSMIDGGIEVRHKQEIKDSLALEAMAHAQFAKQKCAVFHGRRDFLERLKELITNRKNRWVATHTKAFTWWRHQMETFPRYWPFVRGIHWSTVNSRTKASDAELWYFLWSAPEQMVEWKIKTSVIWNVIARIMTSL